MMRRYLNGHDLYLYIHIVIKDLAKIRATCNKTGHMVT